MKVCSFDYNNKIPVQQKGLSFKGYKAVKSEDGFKEFEFLYPFNEDKEECYLEVYKLKSDKYNNYYTASRAFTRDGRGSYKLESGKNRIDLANTFGINENVPFAYHYILKNKENGYTKIRVDSGEVIDERPSTRDPDNIFNVVTPTKSNYSKGGARKLVIIDSQKVGYKYNDLNVIVKDSKLEEKALDNIKTITNKLGGTIAGLEHAVENGEYDKYGGIISLPIFTDDDFSAHAYWNKNCMQMASSLGNINNYASLQRKMFARGLNFVSDGAFVNEGLEGVHFKNVLKWGEDSPYYMWFRASGLDGGPLSMGVFSKNKRYISHKIVNSPYIYRQNGIGMVSIIKGNPKYDASKPTYIQFFDSRMVTDKEKEDTTSLISNYTEMKARSIYNIHTHNDSIFPYAFEIKPETYNANIKRLNEYNSNTFSRNFIDMNGYKASRILSKFENFVVDGKFEGGFETWDANPDIAKLNYITSNADTKVLKNMTPHERQKEEKLIIRANSQVQDYAIMSGQYWTQKTDDILRLSVAQNLKSVDSENPALAYSQIIKNANGKIFPKSLENSLSKNEVENVMTGFYENKRKLSNENSKSQILEGLMNTPMDSFEFGDNLVAVLGSPLISKRANVPEERGVSRYDIYRAGNKNLPKEYAKTYEMMDNLYKNEMLNYAESVLKTVDSILPEQRKLFNGDEVTEYGKYVLPLITPEIAKYAVVKSLAPKIDVAINKNSGEISYDYKSLKQVSLQGLGISNSVSPEEEAVRLLSKMQKGMKNLDSSVDSEMVEAIARKLKDTNVLSFKLADLIIDKTQAGLEWRIDATKDIADVEALRNGNTSFEYTWQQITNFWKLFSQGVLSKNPNSYLVAEVTDENSLHDMGMGYKSGKYPKYSDIVPKFLRETGITSTANYSTLFDMSKMFTKSFEDGSSFDNQADLQKLLYEKMVGGKNPYFHSAPLDSLMYSYTFIGNHDKPRALHCMAMDMDMFYTDLIDINNYDKRLKAYKLINDKFFENVKECDVNNYDFSAVSPKAVAMGYALRKAFITVLNASRAKTSNFSDEMFDRDFKAISKSISDMAQGKFLGGCFDPDAFGVKPFDVSIKMVLKQARAMYGFSLPLEVSSQFENEVFKSALDPAISKLLGMMKYLVALPGIPTLFDGDDLGATGYDSKTKNMYLQGRQRVHDEWAEYGHLRYKDFIAKHKNEFDEVMAVRNNPKCSALNNGAPFMLPLQNAVETFNNDNKVKVPAIFRQTTDGKMAISLFNPAGLNNDYEKYYTPHCLTLDSINLNFEVRKGEDGKLYPAIEDGSNGIGISGLKNNIKFVNAKDENDVYYVNEHDGKYFIKHGSDGGKIKIDDSTLVLYYDPEDSNPNKPGDKYKPSSQYVSNAYAESAK